MYFNYVFEGSKICLPWRAAGKSAANKREQKLYACCNDILSLFMRAYGIARAGAELKAEHS
jgi:hypothetical protein